MFLFDQYFKQYTLTTHPCQTQNNTNIKIHKKHGNSVGSW